MRCRGVEGRLVALLREELDTSEALAVTGHLETCAACRARLVRATRWHALLEAVPVPPLGASRRDALREKALATLRGVPAPAAASRAWPLGAVAVVAATAAGMALWLWPRATPIRPRPTPPAVVRLAAPAPDSPAPAAAGPLCADGRWAVGCARQTGAEGVRADLDGEAELWLEPDTLLGLEGAVPRTRLRLVRGRVVARVVARAGTSFAIAAGEVVATVHGTQFAVERGAARVRVDLIKGAVAVSGPHGERMLGPGQRATFAAGQLAVEPLDAARAATDLARLPESGPAPASQRPGPVAAAAPEPYYRRAEAARRAGRSAEAAQAYRELCRLFPGTAAAANASVALGDVYLGPLGRPAAALRSYDEALAGRPAGAVREEALAGRARALRALSRTRPARDAAGAYLRQYPQGIHAQEMRALAR
jgi:hypothetical protein